MLYIAEYKSRFVACIALSSLSYHLQESTWFSNAQPNPQNLLSLVNLSVYRYWTIYQLFQVLCLEDLQGLDKIPPQKKRFSLLTTRFDISSTKWSKVSKKTRYRDIFQ
jgi:hypothetical protein